MIENNVFAKRKSMTKEIFIIIVLRELNKQLIIDNKNVFVFRMRDEL